MVSMGFETQDGRLRRIHRAIAAPMKYTIYSMLKPTHKKWSIPSAVII